MGVCCGLYASSILWNCHPQVLWPAAAWAIMVQTEYCCSLHFLSQACRIIVTLLFLLAQFP
jgi:hypothetical protein